MTCGQRREPLDDAVHLADVDVPDLPQWLLPRLELPLRVDRQPDVRELEQRLVKLGLREQASAPWLKVEHHDMPAAAAWLTHGCSDDTGDSYV